MSRRASLDLLAEVERVAEHPTIDNEPRLHSEEGCSVVLNLPTRRWNTENLSPMSACVNQSCRYPVLVSCELFYLIVEVWEGPPNQIHICPERFTAIDVNSQGATEANVRGNDFLGNGKIPLVPKDLVIALDYCLVDDFHVLGRDSTPFTMARLCNYQPPPPLPESSRR